LKLHTIEYGNWFELRTFFIMSENLTSVAGTNLRTRLKTQFYQRKFLLEMLGLNIHVAGIKTDVLIIKWFRI